MTFLFADNIGHRIPALIGLGVQESKARERATQHQWLCEVSQLQHGQKDRSRTDLHVVWYSRIHGTRADLVQGIQCSRGLLEPGDHHIRNGGWPYAVLGDR